MHVSSVENACTVISKHQFVRYKVNIMKDDSDFSLLAFDVHVSGMLCDFAICFQEWCSFQMHTIAIHQMSFQ